MKRPFIWIVIPMILGIIFSYYLEFPPGLIAGLLGFALLLFIYNIFKGRTNNIIIIFIFFLIGIINTNIFLNNSYLIGKVNKELEFSGIVHQIHKGRDGQNSYTIKILKVDDENRKVNIKEKIRLKIIDENPLDLGDKISFKGKVKLPSGNTNPKLFNHRLNLLTNRIYTTMSIKNYQIYNIDKGDKPFFYRMKSKFTSYVENTLDNYLEEENSSLMKSIILGQGSYMEDENIQYYRDLGLAHILAVSGLHIGVISGFLIYGLSYLGVKRRINILITLGIIWIYGLILGFPPSLLRANIMFSLLMLSQIFNRYYDPVNILFFAMFIILTINPIMIFSIGFQLSFIATFFIVYITNKISFGKTLRALIAVQLGVLPIQIYYFNRVSLYSIIANLIISPILSLSLVFGGIILILDPIFSPLMIIIGYGLDYLLTIQFYFINIMNKLPFGLIRMYSPSIIEILLIYLIIFIGLGILNIEKLGYKINKSILYYLIFLIFYNIFTYNLNPSINIDFIDVGQGDGILIKSRKGNYLMDTGGNLWDTFDIGKNITVPYLEKQGIFKLDGVFITHFHEDHCKGLLPIMESLKVKNIYVSYKDNNMFKEIEDKKIPITIVSKKDFIYLDNNTRLDIISPDKAMVRRGLGENDLSMVTILNYFHHKIMFTGDIEKVGEESVAKEIDYKVDVIKVPHHGSNTSSTDMLLSKINPKDAIISVGINNLYNHPHPDIINRYKEIGTNIYRTDELGLIKLKLNKSQYNIEGFKKEKEKLYGFAKKNTLNMIYFIFSYYIIRLYLEIKREWDYIEL